MTWFTVSNSKPLPTHNPWSGGSTENWLPLNDQSFAYEFDPSHEANTPGAERSCGRGGTFGAVKVVVAEPDSCSSAFTASKCARSACTRPPSPVTEWVGRTRLAAEPRRAI